MFVKDIFIYIYLHRYDGKTELRRSVPDSITSWLLTAFSISDAYGLGLIQEPRKVLFYAISLYFK